MSLKILLILTATILITSCSGQSASNFKVIPINQLLSDDIDSGSFIGTTGYLQKDNASAVFNLFPYEEDAKNNDLTRAIAVIPMGVIQNFELGNCEQNYVLIKGTFYPESKTNQRQIIPVQEIILIEQEDELSPNKPCWVNPNR